MAQKYYNTQQAAEVFGVSEDDIKQMQESRQLHGYRDGADWKFKVEDVEKLAAAKAESAEKKTPDEEEDVLLSEVELGQSDSGASGTVIGMESLLDASSDIEIGGQSESTKPAEPSGVDSEVSKFEELDLTLEEDLTLEDSQIAQSAKTTEGSSAVDLTGEELDDDELVLGGSGAGSDVTIGGDSGISLVDPADSGISLEEPLDLTGSGAESLELGEDDMISLGEDVDTDAPTNLKTDDDFLLTPLDEVGDEEDSESGSQVIALDTEGEGDEAATMIGGSEMAAMLEEDLDAGPAPGIAPLNGQPAEFAEGVPLTQISDAALPETPYTVLNIVGLALCVVLLAVGGMFTYDLMRNMWSWDTPYEFNSSMMDTILGLFEG